MSEKARKALEAVITASTALATGCQTATNRALVEALKLATDALAEDDEEREKQLVRDYP